VNEKSAWERLKGDGDWRVFKDGDRWWEFPYTVVAPDGFALTVTMTQWGARRAIQKRRKQGPKPPFWEQPIVHRVAP
jgi:hypothetical protein